MIDSLFMLGLSGSALIGLVLLVRYRAGERWRRELVAYELRFARDLDAKAVVSFTSGLAGLVAPRLQRPFAARGLALETSASADGIRHHLLMPRGDVGVVLAQLRAALPSVGVSADETYVAIKPTLAGELGLSSTQRPLAVENPESISAALLASLQPLQPGERLILQWTAIPIGPVAPVAAPASRPRTKSTLLLAGLVTRPPATDALAALRAKQAVPLFAATGRLGVVAADPRRARMLLRHLTAAFHLANAPGAHLRRRLMPSRWVARGITRHRFPLLPTRCVLNAAELGALVGFPLGEVSLPGLVLGGCRQLAPVASIPRRGRVVAQATFPGAERPLAMAYPDGLRHLHVIGPTGVGKSTLLVNLIAQDMAAGHGVVVIDPKADLVSDVLDRVPPERVRDVVLLDPSDDERPVGLNLLAGADEAPDLVVDQVVGTMHNLFRAFWGPRTDDILRAALLTLVAAPSMTLCEVPLLLTEPSFRRPLVGRISDPVALEPFWGWYEGLSEAERAQAIGPVMNKLRAFLLRRRIRNVIGQAAPAFELKRALDERRIILVALSKGLLGEEAAALLGSLIITQLWQAVQHRAALRPEERLPIYLHVDEVQDYLKLPISIGDVLAQARGLGLGLTLAHQHLGQLPGGLRQAVLANARGRVIFQPSAGDARLLAREVAPYLTAIDLQGLGPHEVVVQLAIGAQVAPPATGRTLPPPAPTDQAAAARAHSRARYGRDRADIEKALHARHEVRRGAGPVGRREVMP